LDLMASLAGQCAPTMVSHSSRHTAVEFLLSSITETHRRDEEHFKWENIKLSKDVHPAND